MTGSGLRRFVRPPTPQAAATPPPPDVAERCEMCGEATGAMHGHVVDLHNRSLMCVCRPCALLFTRPESGGGRFRAVPQRYLRDPAQPLTPADWERLGIPVQTAFFLRGEHGTAAFYPSPAGPTECLLDLDAWADLAAEHPLLTAAERDVEAILIRCRGNQAADVDCYLVPIDECYHLVGLVRMHWTGFDGGPDAHRHLDEYFDRVASRATDLAAERG